MPLKIMTTGLEQYAAGGTGRVKTMVIGGPGVGKTRWSSYFPKPIYADCEGGLSSVADRRVPFAPIKSSQDMLDFLVFLRQESLRAPAERTYLTVVIDTLDAFQRKVKDEWLQQHPTETAFRGFDAWGYLDAKMQMLTTRLLNLDMNVIVAVHYTDKTIKEGTGENATERQEYQLQLSGNIKDSIFNDFDLVGWMGTYYEAEPGTGQRLQKRGLTFKPTPDKPFLKDRLHVTPPWMEVTFSERDYEQLFEAVAGRLEDLVPSEEVGEIPSASLNGDPLTPSGGVVGPLAGGALPPQDPREVPLEQHDKPTLLKMARDLGVEGVKGNTLKGELVQMIRAKQAEQAAQPAEQTAPDAPAAPAEAAAPATQAAETPAPQAATSDASPASDPDVTPEAQQPAGPVTPEESGDLAKQTLDAYSGGGSAPAEAAPVVEPEPAPSTPVAAAAAVPVPEAVPASAPSTEPSVDTEAGPVNPTTGEIMAPGEAEAIENVVAGLGAEVISQQETAETPTAPATAPEPAPAPAPAAPAPAPVASSGVAEQCGEEGCSKAPGPNPDFIKLSYIKYRTHLCDEHYLARKKAS